MKFQRDHSRKAAAGFAVSAVSALALTACGGGGGSSSGASQMAQAASIDVFDTNFTKPTAMQGKFVDPTIPANYVPFGITALNNQLYVTYAMPDPALHDEVTGAGMGYVDVYDFSGNFVSRFASAAALTGPEPRNSRR